VAKICFQFVDTACIPFVVRRRHTNRIYSPLPFGIDTNSAETLLTTLITTTLTNSLLDEKSSYFVSSLILTLKGLSEIFKTYVELIKIFLCSVPLFISRVVLQPHN